MHGLVFASWNMVKTLARVPVTLFGNVGGAGRVQGLKGLPQGSKYPIIMYLLRICTIITITQIPTAQLLGTTFRADGLFFPKTVAMDRKPGSTNSSVRCLGSFPHELRTKFRLGATYGGLYRVWRGPIKGIYYKFSPGLRCVALLVSRRVT